MTMHKVQFLAASDVIETRECDDSIQSLIDCAKAVGAALVDLEASAVDALSTIFEGVKFPKGQKHTIESASKTLREHDGMADLRGYLYPTDRDFPAFIEAVKARDLLPKGKRKDQQAAVAAIKAAMKSRIEYLAGRCINAYVSDVLGFDWANGVKRTDAQKLETIMKSLTTLAKSKDELVKACASAMIEARTVTAQAWKSRAAKQKPVPTLEAWTAQGKKGRTKAKLAVKAMPNVKAKSPVEAKAKATA